MFMYSISPIDTWLGWMTEAQFLDSVADEYEPESIRESFEKGKARALDLGRRAGWEGDFSVGLLVAGLPPRGGDSYSELVYGWKQSNDGTTFIASPYRLPWLDEDWPPISD